MRRRLMILMEMMLEVVIGVLVMEVDKVADEVTNMDVDKVTNMMAKITWLIHMEMMLEVMMWVLNMEVRLTRWQNF